MDSDAGATARDVTGIQWGVERTDSSKNSLEDVEEGRDVQVDIGGEVNEIERDCGFGSTAKVAGRRVTGKFGRGFWNSEKSMGVEDRGKLAGRAPRPTSDDTSAE